MVSRRAGESPRVLTTEYVGGVVDWCRRVVAGSRWGRMEDGMGLGQAEGKAVGHGICTQGRGLA